MSKVLTMDNINQNIVKSFNKEAQSLIARAEELEKLLKQGVKLPFTEVIRADLADPQASGQPPVTFLRQVMALCICPSLIENSDFPEDVKQRAQDILQHCKGNSIVLSLLNCPDDEKPAGIMVPVPGHPLYSAALEEYGMVQIKYFLEKDVKIPYDYRLTITIKELQRALGESRTFCTPKAIVVINPGNPTGVILTREEMESIVKFAHSEKLLLLADEVYQPFSSFPSYTPFQSFKRVMTKMGHPYREIQLISFMSASNGCFAECGPRGGCCEMVNIDPEITGMLFKTMASNSSSILGQVALDCTVKPPHPKDPSYELYKLELYRIGIAIEEKLMLSNFRLGLSDWYKTKTPFMFPIIALPDNAIQQAKNLGQEPDYFFASQLLEETGICVLPGSIFGLSGTTYHFRISKQYDSDLHESQCQKIKKFREEFNQKYKNTN